MSAKEADRTAVPAGAFVPLRVCHIASGDLWAGAEAHLANLLTEFTRLPALDVSAILMNEGLLAKRLRERQIVVSVFPEGQLPVRKLLGSITSHLLSTRTDIIHTHGYKSNVLGAVAAERAGVSCIVRTEHGVQEPSSGFTAVRMKLYQALDLLSAYYCSAVVAVSDDLAQQWRLRLGDRGPAVTVIRNGVTIPRELPPSAVACARERLGVGKGEIVFGFLGRLVPVKGLFDLLAAAAIVRRREPRAVFLLAGDGPLRAVLETRVADLGLEDVVRFLGFMSQPSDFLAALDVFVLPSLGEGVPVALLEALAICKPVVATRVGGVGELLIDNVHGLLVAPGNPEELARACERLIADQHLRTSLGQQARALVASQLSADRMAVGVHELYCRIVGRVNGVGVRR